MSFAPGTILGQYEIRSPLGAGGMGEVYRAHDSRLDREVAIKVLPQSVANDPDRLRRFEQEARAAAALNHPNILAVYQMATQDGVSYLVSELLEGETLRERLRRGPIPVRKAVEYAIQIARGLAAPHEKGIVHRDLKPENLFLTDDGRIKILDFGLAKVLQAKDASGLEATLTEGTDPGVVLGTVGYMSPEHVRGKAADHRSDIFAFGTILYELITGKPSFRKATSAETMTAILNEDPRPISQVAPNTPPGLQRIVHRCLEKNPEQRFQSASDLAFALEALSDSAIGPLTGAHTQQERTHVRWGLVVIVLVIAAGAALGTYLWNQPQAAPKVSNYVQLTHDGQAKSIVGTDGSRLYLGVFTPSYQGLAEMSVQGGDPRELPILTSKTMVPLALSPDGSELLAMEAQGTPPRGPVWRIPVLGGSPRRVGEVQAQNAAWSPDATKLAYGDGASLYVANLDGSEVRKIVSMQDPALITVPAWSPDGAHVRFCLQQNVNDPTVLWEVAADGTGLHRLLPGWSKPPDSELGDRWTSDGNYFLYESKGQIWALPRKRGFLRGEPKPIQLTSSPFPVSGAFPSKDGKKLFVVGETDRGELVRFDSKSGQYAPFLGGISAEFAAFSNDGEWVAYVSYPDGTLWRSKVDGSQRLQLSFPPDYAFLPRWSPDNKHIAFFVFPPGKPSRMYEISVEGGSAQPLLPEDNAVQQDPNWSPDGKRIVFSGGAADSSSTVRILDVATHHVETVPGSQGLFSPRWSPDGRYIAALSVDSTRILLFDFQSGKWTEIAKGTPGWPRWSKDGQYIEYLGTSGITGAAVLKVRISDHNIKQVVDLNNIVTAGKYGISLALAPDESPLILRNTGTQDVYSLDWQEQ